MLSLFSATSCPLLSTRAFQSSSAFLFLPPNPRSLPSAFSKLLRASSGATGVSKFKQNHKPIRTSYAGVKLEETVEDIKQGKIRLDSWISSRIEGISGAPVQSSIKSGLVIGVVDKPLRTEPEDMPLDMVYENQHVLVVNKSAHMVHYKKRSFFQIQRMFLMMKVSI